MSLSILYEDNHLIAINKPAGLLVQGDKTGDKTLLDEVKSYIKIKYNKPGDVYLGLIHRIDRPVSGIVVLAKTSKALTRMNELFKTRDVQKTYWAIVEQRPQKTEDTITQWLKKNEKQNKSYASNTESKGGLKSTLSYTLKQTGDRYHLLEVNPATGRHHQIRVQLAGMGSIIKGDLKYGAKRSNEDGSICLHARKLTFVHPIQQIAISITAPVPADPLWQFFEKNNG